MLTENNSYYVVECINSDYAYLLKEVDNKNIEIVKDLSIERWNLIRYKIEILNKETLLMLNLRFGNQIRKSYGLFRPKYR